MGSICNNLCCHTIYAYLQAESHLIPLDKKGYNMKITRTKACGSTQASSFVNSDLFRVLSIEAWILIWYGHNGL